MEERKKDLMERLDRKYNHLNNAWGRLGQNMYVPTDKLADTSKSSRHLQSFDVVLKKSSVAHFVPLLSALAVVIFAAFMHIVFFFIALAVFIILLIQMFDTSEKLVINKDGIWCQRWKMTMPWRRIGATFIRYESNKDVGDALVVHYYDTSIEDFVEDEILLSGMDASPEDVAFAVEYFMAASK